MSLNSIEEIIADIRAGKMVILMDDEDRENEGDIIVAAEKVTPEIINFMATEARGLICLTLTGERCDYLGLPAMVTGNGAKFSTPFTVSIEAAEGVTTGISAADRAATIRAAVNPMGKPEDIVQPGHIFPLRARPGGVLSRAGHTEAGCDLARLAGLIPSSAIVEVMNADGTMARRPDLEVFAKKHGIKIGTIADLIHYRIANEKTIELVSTDDVHTEFGEFKLNTFRDTILGETHLALTMGDFEKDEPTMVRVQTQNMIRDVLGLRQCDSPSWSSTEALKRIAEEGKGALVLLSSDHFQPTDEALDQFFGRAREPRSPNKDSSGAFLTIGTGSQILRELNIGKMRLLSSEMKYSGISGFDLEITEYLPFSE
ncbi:bifunctional 3,4-dihydroxy-2-butanone-4-phosphate synthase/GTP cyclohydrolase II [Thalassolituus sp.]|uniref:bifunctional 3,4-dihydroxy-2-butanone-4-phosphate synthase/GTP cyclohydrolase II n=1 Tax=Thalassolituus sp. TaxID=2030822 RepID=UPI002603FBAC|nr:bifunctional 3,4-dihydroxy-2-butanone-4-phosphate synthase/GTP cyclohydrolase II [uncultured Thalassolituus sp.]TNC92844.1 MAG: 3,4-dihydroxy-2-butanone-4-phosphate synthase [Thalassolituus sp.]